MTKEQRVEEVWDAIANYGAKWLDIGRNWGSDNITKDKLRELESDAKKVLNLNDKDGKPVGIHYHIGKRPVAAFGNSDGDFAMMQYTEANKEYKTLQLYVHHTDSKREWAYDRKSHVGRLDKGLDYANKHHWSIADMKKDWKIIYPFELQ